MKALLLDQHGRNHKEIDLPASYDADKKNPTTILHEDHVYMYVGSSVFAGDKEEVWRYRRVSSLHIPPNNLDQGLSPEEKMTPRIVGLKRLLREAALIRENTDPIPGVRKSITLALKNMPELACWEMPAWIMLHFAYNDALDFAQD